MGSPRTSQHVCRGSSNPIPVTIAPVQEPRFGGASLVPRSRHRPAAATIAALTHATCWVIYNQMVVDTVRRERQTDRLFFALSDATRRDIVTQTLDRERSVSELGRLYPISLTAVQKHVAVLVDAGLVSKHRSGREQLVRGEIEQLRRAHELLDELETLWRARLERFEDVLNETTGKESQ